MLVVRRKIIKYYKAFFRNNHGLIQESGGLKSLPICHRPGLTDFYSDNQQSSSNHQSYVGSNLVMYSNVQFLSTIYIIISSS